MPTSITVRSPYLAKGSTMVRFALLLLLTACTTSEGEWQRYVDPQAGFGMGYPGGWSVTSTKLPESSLAVNGTDKDRGLSCSLYHTRYAALAEVDTRTALAAVSEELLLSALQARFSDVQLSAQPEVQLSSLPARHFTVTYQAGGRGSAATRPYMGQLLVTVANGGIYNFFCGAPVAKFAAKGDVLDRIRESLSILPLG